MWTIKGRADAVTLRQKTHKASSKRWLHRQLNDPFVQQAKTQGLRSRAAFKLEEILHKFPAFLSVKGAIVDLGAAPGGWSQLISGILIEKKINMPIVAVDLLPVDPLSGVTIFQGDFTTLAVQQMILGACAGQPIMGILSDMAPSSSGHRSLDQSRMEYLLEQVVAFMEGHLAPKGWAIIKIFHGAYESLMPRIKPHFDKVKLMRPQASRKESSEMYMILQGKKP